MKSYADMGVQVQVTEFDIQAPRSAQDWNKVSAIATAVLKAVGGFTKLYGLQQLGLLAGLLSQRCRQPKDCNDAALG